jgi:subtilisin family serine protease
MIIGLAVVLAALVLAQASISQRPAASEEDVVSRFVPLFSESGPAPRAGRLMIAAKGPVTDGMRAELSNYATIHGVIARYNLIVATPRNPNQRAVIERLWFVASVEEDQPRYLANHTASWDRDILDVQDVEESGVIGTPDPREVAQTGAGVHVAVIDTGLPKNWMTFLRPGDIRTDLARAFMGGGAVAENFVPPDEFNTSNPTNLWERDTNGHGMAVASHVVGFNIGTRFVMGTAPSAKIIPLKVFPNGEAFTWSSRIIAAIAYATQLKQDGAIGPTVINMSLSGGSPVFHERAAIQDAIANGVIVVASAGNAGESGMGWPGAFPEVIGVGASGWTQQFRVTGGQSVNSWWWTEDVPNDPDGSGPSEETQSFVAVFSSRAIQLPRFGVEPQQLDVLAPGNWTVAPFGHGPNAGFFFLLGTSFSSPLTAGVAALMLEKNPTLTQAQVESIMKSTALPMNANDSRPNVNDPFLFGGVVTIGWDTMCSSAALPCDPVGAGLLQADAALAAVP